MKIKNTYIEVSKKRDIVNKVLVMCMDSFDGFVKIDLFKKELYTFIYAAEEYMKVKVDNDLESIMKKYDKMVKDGDVKAIEELEDYTVLCHMVNNAVIMMEKDNSVEHSVAQMCGTVIAAMNRIANAIENKINEFDVDILQDTNITELMSIVQRLK